MDWSDDAERAIRKVPFFVRKRVRARVESEAAAAGRPRVTVEDVKATQKRYLEGMASEVRGYQVEACFGPSGCPNRAAETEPLAGRIRALLEEEDLLAFLRASVAGELRFHHEFRVGIADCPNACSQVQVKDIGIVGACVPAVTDAGCTGCGACVDACPDGAIAAVGPDDPPRVDPSRCLACGKCVAACPTGTLAEGTKGYRVQLGGKLGRRPRLAIELPGVHSEDRVLDIVRDCIGFFKRNSTGGRRFAQILEDRHIRAYLETGVFPE